jgi:hypothetical protein
MIQEGDWRSGKRTRGQGDRKPKQDAQLPAIALISLGFVIPPHPTPFPVCSL